MKAPKLELVDIDSLEPHAENPNQGDIGTICDLIVHNGWFGQTLVQTREGLPDRVFVGEHRWRARAQSGEADRMITVHCFACPHCVERPSPPEAHNAMEAHYASAHGPLIARLVGRP